MYRHKPQEIRIGQQILPTRALRMALISASLSLTSLAHSKDWWESTPFYEEDGWLDITEWFDGNRYNPTDETWFRWDDEQYQARQDTGIDVDNDWDYDYETDRYDYDEDFHAYHSWPFGYDEGRQEDSWFYDSWDDGFFSAVDTDQDGFYDYALRYSDFDQDGSYDAYWSYRDTDDDGFYEDIDYHAFNDTQPPQQQRQQTQDGSQRSQSASSKAQQIQGEVVNTKHVKVRNQDHLVAEIRDQRGQTTVTDLGPASELSQFNIDQGSRLRVTGAKLPVGNKQIVVAQQVEADGRTTRIQRNPRVFRGQVADTKKVMSAGQEHLVVILSSGQQQKLLVDLGPARKLNFSPAQNDQLEVTGVPVKLQDRKMVMAQEVRHQNRTFTVDRSRQQDTSRQQAEAAPQRQESQQAQTQQQQKQQQKQQPQSSQQRSGPAQEKALQEVRGAPQGQQRVNGEVQRLQTIDVRGAKRQTATVQDQNGQEVLVDLGPAGEFKLDLQQGTQLQAQGVMVQSSDGKPVLVAKSVQADGQQTNIPQGERTIGARKTQAISGRIAGLQQSTVRGETRQLAKLETEQGQTFIIDLGDPKQMSGKLQEGDQITAHGTVVQSGNQQIVLAERITPEQGQSMPIRRSGSGRGEGQESTQPSQSTPPQQGRESN